MSINAQQARQNEAAQIERPATPIESIMHIGHHRLEALHDALGELERRLADSVLAPRPPSKAGVEKLPNDANSPESALERALEERNDRIDMATARVADILDRLRA